MMKTFTHAGVSKLNGEFKARFANDSLRVKVLAKNGHKDIDLIELRHAMTKQDAATYLLSINFDNGNREIRSALESVLEVKEEVKAEAKVTPQVPALDGMTPLGIKTVEVETEDAPF